MKERLVTGAALILFAFAVGYALGHFPRTTDRMVVPPSQGAHVLTLSQPGAAGRTGVPAARRPIELSNKNLFGPPTDDDPAPPPSQQPQQPAAVPEDDPLSHLKYTGTVTYGDQVFAMLADNQSRTETIYTTGDSLFGYKITSIGQEAVTLKSGKKERKLPLSDDFNAVPMMASSPKDVKPDPGNLTSYRDKTYQSFYFQVTGADTGNVWGSAGTYTDDSSLAAAAVHSGALRAGESGVVRVTVLPGYDHYNGSTSNGITSQPYAQWEGSYRVDRL